MRVILFIIFLVVIADSAFARIATETNYIYTNNEVNVDGSPTVRKVVQWVSGRSARTTIYVAVKSCVPLKKTDFALKFNQLGPRNLLKIKLLLRAEKCSNPQIETFTLYSSKIPAIELAEIKVNKKEKILWVYSNRAPHGSGADL